MRSPAQKHTLAVKNGRAGGRARLAKLRQVWNGEPLRLNMLRSHDAQREGYGGLYANLPQVTRNRERQRRACAAAGKAGGIASGAARRAKRDAAKKEHHHE